MRFNNYRKDSILVQFLKQLTDPMIIILLVAAFISGVLVIPIVEIVKLIQRKLAK